jgi:threonine/homoserine/homoserine lactone efflux protein
MYIILLKSILAGFLLGIPVGPLGAMALRRMLTKGALHGVFFGIGFAIVDLIYAIVIGFGMNAFSEFILRNQKWLYLAGMFFFLIVGIKIFFTKFDLDKNLESEQNRFSYWNSSGLSFVLALTSPATFFSFSAVFSALNLALSYNEWFQSVAIILGVILGGFFWWCLLSVLILKWRDKIYPHMEKHMNHIFGGIMILFVMLFVCIGPS